MGRVLAVGLDSGDPGFLDALVGQGRLPNLARLRAGGAVCTLSTHALHRAEHPWTAFVTGRDPVSTGHWTTVHFDPATYEVTARGSLVADPFYAFGHQADVVAVDVPNSVLSPRLAGAQVLGWGTHDAGFPRCSRPAGLLGELETTIGTDASIPLEYSGSWHQPRWIDEYATALEQACRDRTTVVEAALARVPTWTFAVVVFESVHTLGHQCWHGVDRDSILASAPTAALARQRLTDVHVAFDDALGRLARNLDADDVLVVFSPKGMASTVGETAAMLLVPELLHRWSLGEGQLANRALTRWRRKGCPPLVPYAARHVQRRFGLGDDDRHVERRERWLRRRRDVARRVVPGLVERRALPVRRVEPAPFVEPADHELVPVRESLDWHGTTWYRPWWPNQAAFVLPSFADAHIRINLAGRERDGIVARGDYDRACDDVERLLRTAISGRTGRSVVADIYRPRRTDPVASEGPQADLVVSFTEECDALEHPDLGVVGPLPVARTGAHTSEGFAWFAGGGIAPGGRGIRPLVDLPATLCAVAGAGAPGRLDGTPIPMANEPALR